MRSAGLNFLNIKVKGSDNLIVEVITRIIIVQIEGEFSDCKERKHFRIGFLREIHHFDFNSGG